MSVMYSPALKYSDIVLMKSQEMESSIGNHQHQEQQHCHQQNSGLLRYRSAPSSFLASLVEDDPEHYVPSTSSEMHIVLFSKLISPNNGWSNDSEHELFEEKHVKQEEEEEEAEKKRSSGYCYGSDRQSWFTSLSKFNAWQNGGVDDSNAFDFNLSSCMCLVSFLPLPNHNLEF